MKLKVYHTRIQIPGNDYFPKIGFDFEQIFLLVI